MLSHRGFVRLRSLRLAASALLLGLACAAPAPLPVVPALDLDRYQGTWYEIASIPQRFQAGCVGTTATYTRLPDGAVRVANACRDGAADGAVRSIEGRAYLAGDGSEPAKLRVRFFWPFAGDYWVIALDADYRWALVGHPSRDSLWILSRTPTLAPEVVRSLEARATELGFDVSRIRQTPQPGPPGS